MNTPTTPITHGGTERTYQFCKCRECGRIERCTPDFDFYTTARDGDTGPLYCESCIYAVHDRHKAEDKARKEAEGIRNIGWKTLQLTT